MEGAEWRLDYDEYDGHYHHRDTMDVVVFEHKIWQVIHILLLLSNPICGLSVYESDAW